MTKNKKHKKYREQNIRQIHSKQTGAIILIALTVLIVGGLIFFYFAWEETKKIQENEERFRALSCADMIKEGINEPWKQTAFSDKCGMTEEIKLNQCIELFASLEKDQGIKARQNIHDKIKELDC